jgi:CDP-diglyceride synthetase
VLFLLAAANGAPLLVKKAFGRALSCPLDGGATLWDGRRLFGDAKTVRGVVGSIALTALCAPAIGWSFGAGALVAAAAMSGDALSSFLKRRLKIPSSGMAAGLDQIPEALLPALAARSFLPLSAWDIAFVVCCFFLGALVFSRAGFALKLRDQPY